MSFRFGPYIACLCYLFSSLTFYTKFIKPYHIIIFLLTNIPFLISYITSLFLSYPNHNDNLLWLSIIGIIYLVLYMAVIISTFNKKFTRLINIGLFLIILAQFLHLLIDANRFIFTGFPIFLVLVLYKIHII